MTSHNGELKIDALLAKVAAQMRSGDAAAAGESARELGPRSYALNSSRKAARTSTPLARRYSVIFR